MSQPKLTDAEAAYLNDESAKIRTMNAAVQEGWQERFGSEIRAITLLVDEPGRVMINNPVGEVTTGQLGHIVSALLRLGAQALLGGRPPPSENVPPPEIVQILAHAIQAGWGTGNAFVALSVDNVVHHESMTSVFVDNVLPHQQGANSAARAASGLAIQALRLTGEKPPEDLEVNDASTASVVQNGIKALSAFHAVKMRRVSEFKMNAGIPFIRGSGDA